MISSLRGAVPEQLSLLELLEHRSDPNDDHAAADSATRSAGGIELGEWDWAVLRFAAEHHLSGRYAERVKQHLGCSATRYLQALARMLDRPEALTAEPELIGQLQALRDRRHRLRR